MEYKVIKENRKKLVMTVEKDGTVIIKAPDCTPNKIIENFYRTNIDWIEKRKEEHRKNALCGTPPTQREIKELKKQAAQTLSAMTEKYADKIGVQYKSIKITSAKKRWGSCKKDGCLCYSYRTMLLPEKCREYVVVHELCHLKEFNHSPCFYKQIEKILPDYKEREKAIKNFSNYDLY